MVTSILLNILAPILLMVLLGAVMRRKFAIDLGTLSKLNIYLFVPGFVFHRVSTSTLSWSAMGGVVTVTVLQVAMLGLIVWGIGWLLQVNHKTLAAIAMAVMFYNSGNYGLPLAELAYPGETAVRAEGQAARDQRGQEPEASRDGGAVQTFVLMTQNVLTFTIGLGIAAWTGSGGLGKGMVTLFRLPILPTLAAALAARWWLQGGEDRQLPLVISETARFLAEGMVPVALVTLGAQLAATPRWPRWRPVSMVLVLRLVFAPALMAGQLWVFHLIGWEMTALWPWPAELIILTAAVPSAINILLLTLELDGDADLAADCIFWTTVCSAFTITGWLIVIQFWQG